MKACEKKKGISYIYESRCSMLDLWSKSLSNPQKSDPNKDII